MCLAGVWSREPIYGTGTRQPPNTRTAAESVIVERNRRMVNLTFPYHWRRASGIQLLTQARSRRPVNAAGWAASSENAKNNRTNSHQNLNCYRQPVAERLSLTVYTQRTKSAEEC